MMFAKSFGKILSNIQDLGGNSYALHFFKKFVNNHKKSILLTDDT